MSLTLRAYQFGNGILSMSVRPTKPLQRILLTGFFFSSDFADWFLISFTCLPFSNCKAPPWYPSTQNRLPHTHTTHTLGSQRWIHTSCFVDWNMLHQTSIVSAKTLLYVLHQSMTNSHFTVAVNNKTKQLLKTNPQNPGINLKSSQILSTVMTFMAQETLLANFQGPQV